MRARQGLARILIVGFGLSAPVIVTGCGGGGSASSNGTGGSTSRLIISAQPVNLIVSPGVTFSMFLSAYMSGGKTTASITMGSLPLGLTTTTTFPMTIPAEGATLKFTTASTIAPGNYNISIIGTAGGVTSNNSIPFQVATVPAALIGFSAPPAREVALTQGGSASLSFQLTGASYYDVSLGVSGLPTGVTATITPQVTSPTGSFIVKLTASNGAAVAQNVPWNVTATPAANVPSQSLGMLLDITPTSGVGWTNRTSYVSTRATPFSAVYDPVHQLIYSSNQVWNRIDVISDAKRSLVGSIPIRDPRGLDISIDGTRVWVTTGSQVMYSIDTSTQKATRYKLPRFGDIVNPATSWEGAQALSLVDGTVMLVFSPMGGSGVNLAAIWNPVTNALSQFLPLTGPPLRAVVARSGDGKHVFFIGDNEPETSFTYDVASRTLSTPVALSTRNYGYAFQAAANLDGSRVAVGSVGEGFTLYDGSLNLIASLPGDGGLLSFSPQDLIFGGFVFSPDGTKLYEETGATSIATIITLDLTAQRVAAVTPAMPITPLLHVLNRGYYTPIPFAVDKDGMVLGVQYHGISFDDATAQVDLRSAGAGTPAFMNHMSVYSGPLHGGTTSGGFGDTFSLVPDVFYGQTKGTASMSQSVPQFLTQSSPEITSPPATVAGPVDVKMLFPDGVEVFNPQFFTYGTQLQDAITSGGAPEGGAEATLDAFGLPIDPSQSSVIVGGNTAAVTSTKTQYPPFTDEQSAMYLSYTVPSGAPGRADLTVNTPYGTSTLSKAFLYAKSVRDYALKDSPTFVLYDGKRNQLYLSVGDHIDTFSLSSLSFSTPLQSPVAGGSQFQGLSLTPDGKYLLAADMAKGALAVIDPDAPARSFEINLPGSIFTSNQCGFGPLFVAADNQGHALVTSGTVIATGCSPQPFPFFIADLTARNASQFNAPGCGILPNTAAYLSGSHDGSLIGMGGVFNIYLPAQKRCIPAASPRWQNSISVAGDGNVLGLDLIFVDPSGNIEGRSAVPKVLYPGTITAFYYSHSPFAEDGALQNPTLNDAGSLYYWAYPSHIDVVDVQHGTLSLRFALTETVTNTVAPMAIDSGGRQIYLITDKGLTIVDLGEAPLSVGHLSQTTANVGTPIVIRGSGFENGIQIKLGSTPASLSFTDANTLTMTVPGTNSGLQDLFLANPDGTTYKLENALTVR